MLRCVKTVPCLALLLACGCHGDGGSQKGVITQYPKWDWQSYQRVAVLPFEYSRKQRDASEPARQATFMLEDMLAANGSFTVLARDALKDVMTEQDLSQLADVADPSTLLPPGKIQVAQAIIAGKITDFDLKAERAERQVPVLVMGDKGRRIKVREKTVEVFRNAGTVGASVRVIDAATSKVVFSYRVAPITFDDSQQGSPPRATPQELAIEAAKEAAVDCYKHVAPITLEVKLKSDCLITALDYYDGEYDKEDRIPTDLEQFLVVVRNLPRQCERNQFVVAIAPKEGHNFWQQEFTWSANNPTRGMSWEVPLELLTSAGAAEFEAKLYSAGNDAPLLKRSFKLREPKKD